MGCGCNSSGYTTQAEKTLDCGCGCAGLKKSDYLKGRTSLQAALLFFVVGNPVLYKLTGKLLGDWVATNGCPTTAGVVLHSVVFFILTFLIMKITLPTPF